MVDQLSKAPAYLPYYPQDRMHRLRSTGLSLELSGALERAEAMIWEFGSIDSTERFACYAGIHPRIAPRVLTGLVTAGALQRDEQGHYRSEFMDAELAKFRSRSAAATAREQRKSGVRKPLEPHSSATRTAKLSENGSENNGTPSTGTALLKTQAQAHTPPSPPDEDEDFRKFWAAWPEHRNKHGVGECALLFRQAVAGAYGFAPIDPQALVSAAEAHAAKHRGAPQYAGTPKNWLTAARWLDYTRRVESDPNAVPVWDDAAGLATWSAQGFDLDGWIVAHAVKGNGWHPALGHSLTSGERTALHDYIAGRAGLINRLAIECGTDIPGWLRDAADMARPAFVPRVVAVGGRPVEAMA